jgi:hypothetical protein
MLPDDSFLRRLPASLDPIVRLRFEAIVFSSDVLSNAYQSLCEVAARFDHSRSFSTRERIALFSSVWTIVDQLHVLRQLIQAMTNKTPGPNQQRFLDLSQNATLMRNRMDHLSGNLKNLSAQKGRQIPLFGTVAYFFVSAGDVQDDSGARIVTGGTAVVLSAGSIADDKLLMSVSLPQRNQDVRIPVGQFLFDAFKWRLDIDAALLSLGTTLVGTARKVEDNLMDQLKALSEQAGKDVSELAAPLPMSDLGIAMRISFDSSEQ